MFRPRGSGVLKTRNQLNTTNLFLYQTNLSKFQSVSHGTITTETRVQSQATLCGAGGERRVSGQVFLPVLRFHPLIIPGMFRSNLSMNDGTGSIRPF